jgi:hypothetical protein
VEGKQWAKGYIDHRIVMPQKTSQHLEMPITLEMTDIKKNLKDYLAGDKVQSYRITLSFMLKVKDQPVDELKTVLSGTGILHLKKMMEKAKDKKEAKKEDRKQEKKEARKEKWQKTKEKLKDAL